MAALNQYTQLLYYIKQLGEGDNYINTITKGENVDLDKITIFPLLHIDINNASFPSEGTISFSVELSCMDVRDINNEVNTDKFWGQDNEVDNLNNTLAALNRIWRILNRGFIEHNITASDNPTLDARTSEGKNLLDGWQMNFDVEMPNVAISLADEVC
jgi:hypothetical protein